MSNAFANRYRQILQAEANMGMGYQRPPRRPRRRGGVAVGGVAVGGYGTRDGGILAAKYNPWIQYLKLLSGTPGAVAEARIKGSPLNLEYYNGYNAPIPHKKRKKKTAKKTAKRKVKKPPQYRFQSYD
jgi:hypothetical protein